MEKPQQSVSRTDEGCHNVTLAVDKPALNLLFIAYYFPPENVVAAARAAAFAKYLPTHGIQVTILTPEHHGSPEPAGTSLLRDGIQVVRIGHTPGPLQKTLDLALRIRVFSRFVALFANLLGHFSLGSLSKFSALRNAIRQRPELRDNDVVLVSSSPQDMIRLGAWMNRRYGLPFIADYRDHFDNRLLSNSFRPTCRERAGIALKRYYHRKWTRTCRLLVSVSGPLLQVLGNELGVVHRVEVRNGYDPELLDPDPAAIDRRIFRILYSGMIYPHQNIDPFLAAMDLFLHRLSLAERSQVCLAFHGVGDQARSAKLKAHFHNCATVDNDRIPQVELHRTMATSTILLIFDYGQTGVYSGKLMEYTGMHRNILLIPSDNGVMQDLIQEGKFGLATSEPEKAADFLYLRFHEWKESGAPFFEPDPTVVADHSMARQVGILAHAVRSMDRSRPGLEI